MSDLHGRLEDAARFWEGQVDETSGLFTEAADAHEKLVDTLAEIARGREDNGRPLGGHLALHRARETLVDLGIDWSLAPTLQLQEESDG